VTTEDELRHRLDALEHERANEIAKANAAVAAAQDRSYWLDRLGLDLNRLMQRPGVSELLTALRAVRLILLRAREALATLAALPDRIGKARQKASRDVERG
jgi:hypothetical protein